MLQKESYELIIARNGEMALKRANHSRPNIILLDILTIRELQTNLQHQVDELDAFARTVAHDLKNPIGTVVSSAKLMIDLFDTLTDQEKLTYLKILLEGGEKGLHIIDELLLLAGVHRDILTLEPFDMGAVVSNALSRLTRLIDRHDATISAPNHWPPAIGYSPWVEQIWLNYLSNALKYGGRPPHVTIGATTLDDGFICFWVQDNGKGVAPDEQNKLFTEFTRLGTTRTDGHGLGLSIVRRIVEKLGGRVGIESEMGQGSRFYFTLRNMD